ncbi:DUF805 domain-containing protein [Nocardioides conyzicola]|uniref:DUF805 domain-containing protein n=1 Tax=Nocardioides conyzicola TaxID=1651781 RepID=A0ABP8WRV4_9ACTN
MTFGDAVSVCFSKYATFAGRATRPEYWWFFLFGTIVSVITTVIDSAAGLQWDDSAYGPVSALGSLLVLLPTLAVGSRRLHDTGRTGWWQLLFLLPCIGPIILIVLFCQAGERRPNKYGDGAAAY